VSGNIGYRQLTQFRLAYILPSFCGADYDFGSFRGRDLGEGGLIRVVNGSSSRTMKYPATATLSFDH
jgi:hypothetical protein